MDNNYEVYIWLNTTKRQIIVIHVCMVDPLGPAANKACVVESILLNAILNQLNMAHSLRILLIDECQV
jgi:hypothetical protein